MKRKKQKKRWKNGQKSIILNNQLKWENITINIDALKKYGKDTSQIKNTKKNKQCNDIESYVSIKIKKDAKNIEKDFILEKVVLDCFE